MLSAKAYVRFVRSVRVRFRRKACAASGLNDLDSTDPGQLVSQVQTAADSWKYYGLPKGAPGTLGLCRGGTGER